MNSDTDRDGQTLLMEWALGLDPQQNGARDAGIPPQAGLPVFEFVPTPVNPGTYTLCCRYARRTGVPGLLYDVEFSTATGGGWQPTPWEVVEEWNNDWETVTAYYNGNTYSTAPAIFGRLRVTWAP